MVWNSRVVWSEGMFLRPEHFQQHDRYFERFVENRAAPLSTYFWGHVRLELDTAALALGKVQLVSGRGILPDGTPFDFPGNDPPPEPLDIAPDTRDELIVLALGIRRPGTSETASDKSEKSGLVRFGVTETDVGDSNAGSDRTARIQVGRLRLQLLRKRDASDAHATLGVVRVAERRPDNLIVLDGAYIAPVLNCTVDSTLANYLRDLRGLLFQRGEALSARVGQPGKGGVSEIADYLFLQTVNRYQPLFDHLSKHSQLHPERLFSAMLMLAGDLSIFGRANRRPRAVEAYQHDELERCFPPLMDDIRANLSVVLERHAIPIELIDKKYGVRVGTIPDPGMLTDSSLILAANAQLPPDVLRSQFPKQAKVGPVERIRDLVNLQLPGIPLRPLPIAPRQIPFHAGFNYFEIERGSELWNQLRTSGGLAIHVPTTEFPGLEAELWAIRE